MKGNSIKEVQNEILDIMKYIDRVCRKNHIDYYIMGGTALGAVRHGGFIPWDDDLDIFMTPKNYYKFKNIINNKGDEKFVLQEWKTTEDYLEYSKLRKNGTTFIEEAFKDRKDIHQGIYVDIMILHKVPKNIFKQKLMYYLSKYVTLFGLSRRNWKPKNFFNKMMLNIIRIMPNKLLSKLIYKYIYKYDNLEEGYDFFYFITKANFKQGVFDKEIFKKPVDICFEDTILYAPTNIKKYLSIRYGNYMKLPPKNKRENFIHAMIYDIEKGYKEYLDERERE